MNAYIGCKPNAVFSILRYHVKWCPTDAYNCRTIHSKCWTQVNASRRLLSPNVTTSVYKRFINYARLRTYWRIIRLKDRGVEHNFKKDAIDRTSNILVYKAEINRIATMGGILFPAFTILLCIVFKLLPEDASVPPDPHHNPGLMEKYILEIMIITSLFHINLSRRYVLRMYFNRKTRMFSVSTWRWFMPFKTHTFQCKPGAAVQRQVIKSDNPLVATIFGNCKIDGKTFFVNESHFTFPVYYNVLFGFSDTSVVSDMKELDSGQMDKLVREREKKLYN